MQWIVIRGLIVYDDEGARRIVGGLRDITPQMEAQHKLDEAERMRANLSRYFSSNIVESLMQKGGKLNEASTQNVTVMFADIWGFTAVSAKMPGKAVIGLLRDYLGLAERAVFSHGGTLDKFLGDGLMATFGTPTPGPDDAANALACARAMADAVVKWNAKRKAQGLVPLRIGIGLHCGEVAVGEVGSERRMEFAVIGDTVNIAARIQEMTRELDLAMLASDAVIAAAGPEAASGFRDLGEQAIRGRGGSVRLWGRAAEQSDQ
jgi:adenylate cyclase